MPFTEHQYHLFLDYKLYLATIQLQADLGLGKAYSGMLPFVEGLYKMGYLEDEDYELYKNKYSVGLIEVKEPKSPEQIRKEQSRDAYRKEQNAYFGQVLAQWAHLKPHSKKKHLENAALPENRKIKNAKLVLELGAQETVERHH